MMSHGGTNVLELQALGLTEADILDLSVNVVPFEIPEAIRKVMQSWDPRAYPDPACVAARTALADRFEIPVQRVIVGNGATELIWTLFDAIQPRSVLVLAPTFSEFHAAANTKQVPIRSIHDPAGIWPTFDEEIHNADLVYFTHPNNPTGRPGPLDRAEAWALRHPDTLFMADESFLSLSAAYADIERPLPDNIIRLRSLTKDFGLAGLRIGYAIAPQNVAQALEAVRPPWTVNGLAQAVVPAALSVEDSIADIRARLFTARNHLDQALCNIGLQTIPSSTIYVMVRVGDAGATKTRLLSKHAIRVRDCSNFGMPAWIRVAAREGSATDRLVAALAEAHP
ncbi:MAG: aminotransferase class I/II-fold pyridoxal phosphate-dependent enzyme [Myxococcota bacterium]